jgi:hypothetical protein
MPDDVIKLGSGNDFMELEVLERGTHLGQSEGDLRLRASVEFEQFAGTHDEIWIDNDDWTKFILSLTRLELERTGAASLVSMSPDEFELHLEIIDPAGHLDAHGCLSRYHFGSGTLRSRIEYRVGIDPSMLRELLMQFSSWQPLGSHHIYKQ